jgi:hypothetical protein
MTTAKLIRDVANLGTLLASAGPDEVDGLEDEHADASEILRELERLDRLPLGCDPDHDRREDDRYDAAVCGDFDPDPELGW